MRPGVTRTQESVRDVRDECRKQGGGDRCNPASGSEATRSIVRVVDVRLVFFDKTCNDPKNLTPACLSGLIR